MSNEKNELNDPLFGEGWEWEKEKETSWGKAWESGNPGEIPPRPSNIVRHSFTQSYVRR